MQLICKQDQCIQSESVVPKADSNTSIEAGRISPNLLNRISPNIFLPDTKLLIVTFRMVNKGVAKLKQTAHNFGINC